ncbi:DM13 domain-containing protein [Arcanobacterium pinnipediorum]|uniref:DM13 domain-containing protein n=1 Tax=Arcanobacterium pinnipediorum TaxID=1503041 RepID=A0ABY5AGQ0_9ACTO|nr:DM13 domain-containing protein [Arcanobacterium pinnipediorum]USR79369.1 DM13 domain-containing protein [Arcanobacterium pinnipediorum]
MKKIILIAAPILLVVLITAALIFKPWLAFIDKDVNDALPTIPSVSETDSGTSKETDSAMEKQTEDQSNGPAVIAEGTFVTHAHDTTGMARIVRLESGKHQLVFENLDTTNGPDVHVWLSKADVVTGSDGNQTAGNSPHLDVAPIKGNTGNHVYDLPADFNPSEWKSVDLWCDQFSVSFGAAQLTPLN